MGEEVGQRGEDRESGLRGEKEGGSRGVQRESWSWGVQGEPWGVRRGSLAGKLLRGGCGGSGT